jgi:hypothetical protein
LRRSAQRRHGAVPRIAAPDSPPSPSIKADDPLVAPIEPSMRGSGTVMGAGSVVVVRAIVVDVVDDVVVVSSTAIVTDGR